MPRKRYIFLAIYIGSILLFLVLVHIYLSHRLIHVSLPANFKNEAVVLSYKYTPSFLFLKKGYTLKDCEMTGISILVKNTWYFSSDHSGSIKTCYITVEPLQKEGTFKTGITIEIVDDYANKTQIPIQEYVYNYMKDLKNEELNVPIQRFEKDNFIGYSNSLIQTDEIGQYKKKKYVTALANIKTNTLYILSYETPIGEEKTHQEALQNSISAISLDTLH